MKIGVHGTEHIVSYVKHELRKDQEVTLFSIADVVNDRNGSPAKLPNGNTKRMFFQVTAWEELPLLDGQKVRLEFISDMTPFEMKNKAGYLQTYFSITAKVVIVQ
jgi:hypothetical protein